MTPVQSEGVGPGCWVVVNQAATDPGGWYVDLFVSVPGRHTMSAFVRRIGPISAPAAGNPPCRVVEVITLPGAERWMAEVVPPAVAPARTMGVGVFAGAMTGQGPANVAV